MSEMEGEGSECGSTRGREDLGREEEARIFTRALAIRGKHGY